MNNYGQLIVGLGNKIDYAKEIINNEMCMKVSYLQKNIDNCVSSKEFQKKIKEQLINCQSKVENKINGC